MTSFIHSNALVEGEIGEETRVWAFAHVMKGAKVGSFCNIGEGCFIENGAKIGNHVTIKNGVAVWDGVTIDDYAFVGPSVCFTNDLNPRSWIKPERFAKTKVCKGASIGANATIICGITLDEYCMIGAGAVVTKDVSKNALVFGVPASHKGWVCECGVKLEKSPTLNNLWNCSNCLKIYFFKAQF